MSNTATETVQDSSKLIIPIYVNEKIVLDMLAIIEDGFSTVSQVNFVEYDEDTTEKRRNFGNTTSLLKNLLKLDIDLSAGQEKKNGDSIAVTQERIHTTVSLLSKFRSYLCTNNILKSSTPIDNITIGDLIEIKGELQKNPLLEYLEKMIEVFNFAEIFSDNQSLANNNQTKRNKHSNQTRKNSPVNQIRSFIDTLTTSGTQDYILSNDTFTTVLSAQEQYLSNDNISEILGGEFKVLGKVIAVYKDEKNEDKNEAEIESEKYSKNNINLFRKTPLSLLPSEQLNQMLSAFNSPEMQAFNLPKLKTEIPAPAIIVIPIAIYA